MQATGDFLAEAQRDFSVYDLATPRSRNVIPALVCYLRRRRPDALLAAMWPLTILAPLARSISGHCCKILVSEHNTLSVQYREWGIAHSAALRLSMALCYRLADVRVGVSAGVVDDLSGLSGISQRSFHTIHNPLIPSDKPSPEAIAMALHRWSAGQGAHILTVGSLKEQKNHPLLLQAFARMALPDAKLMILGQGKGETALRNLAIELGISDRVILAGFHPDPSAFYAGADLFVLSSDYEGFGNVIVEALSFGLPVVSTDCPSGPAEILENGRWGRLTPVGDAEALARAMEEALSTPVDREALKRRAADFSPEIAARKYLDLLGL
jgi:glycosyltransferase involved in cell wall biosynthesis